MRKPIITAGLIAGITLMATNAAWSGTSLGPDEKYDPHLGPHLVMSLCVQVLVVAGKFFQALVGAAGGIGDIGHREEPYSTLCVNSTVAGGMRATVTGHGANLRLTQSKSKESSREHEWLASVSLL